MSEFWRGNLTRLLLQPRPEPYRGFKKNGVAMVMLKSLSVKRREIWGWFCATQLGYSAKEQTHCFGEGTNVLGCRMHNPIGNLSPEHAPKRCPTVRNFTSTVYAIGFIARLMAIVNFVVSVKSDSNILTVVDVAKPEVLMPTPDTDSSYSLKSKAAYIPQVEHIESLPQVVVDNEGIVLAAEETSLKITSM
ncbi:hypothetical protein Tco_0807128 [Tanacetum coccineum]